LAQIYAKIVVNPTSSLCETRSMLRPFLLAFIVLLSSQVSLAQRVLTLPDFTAFTASGVNGLDVRRMLPLPDGGQLAVGSFEVSYEGRVFRDVLRLKADGLPDTRWLVQANAAIQGAVVLPAGVLVYGPFNTVNGQAAPGIAYLAFDVAPTANPSVPRRLRFDALTGATRTVPGSFDAATGWVYMTSTTGTTASPIFAVNRVNAATGLVDTAWQIALPTRAEEIPTAPLLDRGGGVWVTWLPRTCFCLTGKMARYSIAEPTRELVANIATGYAQAPFLEGDFAYVGVNRYRITDGTIDAAWRTAVDVFAMNRGYAYALTSTTQAGAAIFELRRASVLGNGSFDAWSLALPESRFARLNTLVPLSSVDASDAMGVIAFDRTLGAYGLVSRSEIATTDVTVIEYYVPLAERFFITARKDEQDTLELYPRNFIATGMSFKAKSSRYRDAIEQPVCRFYSSPARGGSNTHFYGSGSDCAALNTATAVQYEGYDFSVRQPKVDINKEALCPDDAPLAVLRLYNNKAASNDSSHRYVVSLESANRMVKTGWLNEGAVFCTTQVTGATIIE
jgi:hypothetical protein